MIEETYRVFSGWDLAQSKRHNLDRLRRENYIGARSDTWLRDIAKVLNRRFDPEGRDRPLVVLAQRACDLHVWKPLLLWHMTRDEFLVRDFLVSWLYPAYEAGAYRVRPEELHAWLLAIPNRGGTTEHAWTETTLKRVAAGLLKLAADFELLRGSTVKALTSYHLPEASFLYLLHAMRDELVSPRKVIDAPDWRMYFVRPGEVERELLRLHQYRTVEFQAAGSLVELRLPCATAREYAETMMS